MNIPAAVLLAFSLLSLRACEDEPTAEERADADLAKLCQIADEVTASEHPRNDQVMEIARRFTAYDAGEEAYGVWTDTANQPFESKYEFLQGASRDIGVSDWSCPSLATLWADPAANPNPEP